MIIWEWISISSDEKYFYNVVGVLYCPIQLGHIYLETNWRDYSGEEVDIATKSKSQEKKTNLF